MSKRSITIRAEMLQQE